MASFVFLPGTLCDARLWHHQTEVFKTHTVVNLRTQESVGAMVESVAQSPFEKFILVGFSMGGYIAQEFALQYPERVLKLVLMGSSCEGYPPGEKEIIQRALPQIEKGMFRGLTEKRLRQFLHPRSYDNPAIRELVRDMAGGDDAGAVYRRQLNATLDRRNLSQEIGSLHCPMSVLAGKDDQIVPVESILRMEQYAPRAEIHVLSECGHFVPLERPDQVNEILYYFSQ
jgi:pimeloyl-ACP methyl ester carboxylesterase